MGKKRVFRWLHLSDMHVGLAQEGLLWSNVKAAFFDDLKSLLEKTGPVDVVIFSGDLTQKASPKEYERLNTILAEIWTQLEQLNSAAPLFPVPGNHDVARARKVSAAGLLIKRWWQEPEARAGFWQSGSELRRFVEAAFRPYSKWLERCPQVRALQNRKMGILPGDLEASLNIRDLNVGLIGLNSAWLQLDGSDYEKKLNVDLRQLLSLTDDDPAGWRKKHDVALLITHHPLSWLHSEAIHNWQSEINSPGRFDAHLFGHMHVADSQSVSHGGSERRTALQASSLFGLETLADGNTKRIHGYSVGQIELTDAGKVRTVWPRILHRSESGRRRFIPDFAFDLDEENRFTELYSKNGGVTPGLTAQASEPIQIELTPVAAGDSDELEAVRYRLGSFPPHESVRVPEQKACLDALGQNRLVWVQAEWGLGGDGFVWSVLRRIGKTDAPVYRFDFSEFQSREEFLDSIKRTSGYTFEKLCALIAKQPSAYIIFDNVDPLSATASSSVFEEVQEIAAVVLDYCPESAIFIRSRSAPTDGTSPIRLRPLDEADTATYVLHAPLGGEHLSRPDNAAKLFRVTDGAPSRLDSALKSLQVVGLDDLIAQDADYSAPTIQVTDAPDTLVRAVHELRDSDDPHIRRSFELLKTLTVFPQGEQLDPIRRFDNAFPFFPPHATQLLDRGLIDASPIAELAPSDPGLEVRVLTVARSIREFVRAEMTPNDIQKMDQRALEVYFGRDWKSGELTSPVGHKFDEPLQHGYKIANANALLLRLMSRASSKRDLNAISTAFRVIAAYFAALIRGNHYRSVVALAGDLTNYLDDENHEREATLIKSQYAKALRMVGQNEKARDVLENVDRTFLTRDAKRSALLNLALAYETLDDPRAKDIADEVIKLGKTEPQALHARSIIIQATEAGEARYAKLYDLENEAKRRKYLVLANTIALIRANDDNLCHDNLNTLLDEVVSRARESKDFYNGVRAIVKICNIKANRGECLSDQQKTNLINAYHFLFNERLAGLFDNCHSALWSEFERGADMENLLRLFRHSSLIWRLRDNPDREEKYLKLLARRVKPNSNVAAMLPREAAYFLARAGAVLVGRTERRRIGGASKRTEGKRLRSRRS